MLFVLHASHVSGGLFVGAFVCCRCYIRRNAKKVDEAVRRVIDYVKGNNG